MKIAALIPLHADTIQYKDSIQAKLKGVVSRVVFVISNEERDTINFLNTAKTEINRTVTSIFLPSVVGKAQAMREGLKEIVFDKEITHVIQTDGRGKIPLESLEELCSTGKKHPEKLILANRYSSARLAGQPHRSAIIFLFSEIYRGFLGYELTDGVCGTRLYPTSLAKSFTSGFSQGYGWEAEQLLIASRSGARAEVVSVEANTQHNATNCSKLIDTINIFRIYAIMRNLPNWQIYFSSFATSLTQRRDFAVTSPTSNTAIRFRYTKGEMQNAYGNQSPQDAYQLSIE